METHNLAVWSKPGLRLMLNDFGSSMSAYNTIFEPRLDNMPEHRPRQVEVTTTSLDEIISQGGRPPDFLKIDAESAEFEILQGARKLLLERRPIVTLEVGDLGTRESKMSSKCVGFLIESGYQAFEVSGKRVVEHVPGTHYSDDNLLFLPQQGGA